MKPNYKDGSILNLMSSVGQALGKNLKYNPLKILNPKDLTNTNLILIVIDGMGYDYFLKYGHPELKKYLKGSITSVFPSVTSAAMTSLSTGLDCIEHGMTGWYLNLKNELIISLPYIFRKNRKKIKEDILNNFNLIPFSKGISSNPYHVYPNSIVNSVFTKAIAGKSKRKGYKTMKQFFLEIKKIINSNNKKKFIFAYYTNHDGLSHKYGSNNKKVIDNFNKLQKEISRFIKNIKNSDIIITADHGIIDIPKSNVIDLKNHPKFKETLKFNLCGDSRE